MGLQDIIIERYFENFPKQSLRGISANTDMQITRVFRILNGSPMKLCEYESFENSIRKKALVHEVFLNREAVRVFGNIFVGNTPSRSVFEKLDFSLEGTIRSAICKRGKWLDEWIMAITRDDWKNSEIYQSL